MAKANAVTAAVDVSLRALEKFGGMGIMFENEWPAQRTVRDGLTCLHADGTVEAHRAVISDAIQERFAEQHQ
jgi:alkylation response protein AidB-like acyl-CoA dehydrogenase